MPFPWFPGAFQGKVDSPLEWGAVFVLVGSILMIGFKYLLPMLRSANGPNRDALARQEAVAELKAHIDAEAKESRDRQEKLMGNINDTRHSLAQPLTTIALTVALMEKTLIEIRDRLPRA